MMILTRTDVLNDIAAYTARIIAAEDKLAGLPAGRLPFKEHKKREQARKVLKDEVRHVENLIEIAQEALIGLE